MSDPVMSGPVASGPAASGSGGAPNASMFHALARAAGFLIFWLVLAGYEPADLPIAVAAALAATWTSLRLLPPDSSRASPVALVRLTLRFLWQSVGAGGDVARRALDPRLPLRPGLMVYPVRFPPGRWRNTFAARFTRTTCLAGFGARNGSR